MMRANFTPSPQAERGKGGEESRDFHPTPSPPRSQGGAKAIRYINRLGIWTASLGLRWLVMFGGVVVVCLLVFPTMGLPSFGSAVRQTQLQLNQEECDKYKKADAEMNSVYRRITQEYKRDAIFIAALKKAQLAWIRYRDADLESVFPGDPGQYGSINPMCRCMHLADVTKERTRILQQWVDGLEEGDVCAGSVKVK